MDRLHAQAAPPDGAQAEPTTATPTELRHAGAREDFATALRAVANAACLAACNLERGGPADELAGMLLLLAHLQRQAEGRGLTFGHIANAAGSA